MACNEGGSILMECSICLDKIHADNCPAGKGLARVKCGHKFHLHCIGSAFNFKGKMECPICRTTENSQWRYAAPPLVSNAVTTRHREVTDFLLQASSRITTHPCPMHDHVTQNPHLPPANPAVTIAQNVQGSGIYSSLSLSVSGQAQPVNRRRARDPRDGSDGTTRPRTRTRFVTDIYNDPSSVMNPNANGGNMGTVLRHPVHVPEQMPTAVLVGQMNLNNVGDSVGPTLHRPVSGLVRGQVPVNQNNVGRYVGPILRIPMTVPGHVLMQMQVEASEQVQVPRLMQVLGHVMMQVQVPGLMQMHVQGPGQVATHVEVPVNTTMNVSNTDGYVGPVLRHPVQIPMPANPAANNALTATSEHRSQPHRT